MNLASVCQRFSDKISLQSKTEWIQCQTKQAQEGIQNAYDKFREFLRFFCLDCFPVFSETSLLFSIMKVVSAFLAFYLFLTGLRLWACLSLICNIVLEVKALGKIILLRRSVEASFPTE